MYNIVYMSHIRDFTCFLSAVTLLSLPALSAENQPPNKNVPRNVSVAQMREMAAATKQLAFLVKEIVSTESSYLENLKVVSDLIAAIDDRLPQLRKDQTIDHHNLDMIQDLRGRLIALNHERLIRDSQPFLAELQQIKDRFEAMSIEEKQAAYDEIIRAFEDHLANTLQAYTQAYGHHTRSMSMVAGLSAKDPGNLDSKKRAKFMKMNAMNARAHDEVEKMVASLNLKKNSGEARDPWEALSSSVIAPIQRLPRYELLVKELDKNGKRAGLDLDDGVRASRFLASLRERLFDLNRLVR